jgi:hypothetical protein
MGTVFPGIYIESGRCFVPKDGIAVLDTSVFFNEQRTVTCKIIFSFM